jgi:hypothetical protein
MSQGFFQEDLLKNEAADEPWRKTETDKMLDLYFAGSHPREIALKLQRNPKAINRRIEQFRNNERDRAVLYTPVCRTSRKGVRWTESERLILAAHAGKVPAEATAKVLAREVTEIKPAERKTGEIKALNVVAPSIDLIMALRYIFHCYPDQKPVVSDKDYDDLVKEEIEFGGASPFLKKLGDPKDSPSRIKTLALYLCQRRDDEKGKK